MLCEGPPYLHLGDEMLRNVYLTIILTGSMSITIAKQDRLRMTYLTVESI